MSDLGTIREVGLEPGYTGSISTKKAVKFGKKELSQSLLHLSSKIYRQTGGPQRTFQ